MLRECLVSFYVSVCSWWVQCAFYNWLTLFPCVRATAGEDNQLMSKDFEVSSAEADADSSRHSEEIRSVGDATDEGGTSQEQAHIALPEEAGEEEVGVLFMFTLLF